MGNVMEQELELKEKGNCHLAEREGVKKLLKCSALSLSAQVGQVGLTHIAAGFDFRIQAVSKH